MEKHFKNKLESVKVDWDKEELWQEMEPKLPRKKSKVLRIIFLGLILLAIGGVWWMDCYKINASKNISVNDQILDATTEEEVELSFDAKVLLEENNQRKADDKLIEKQERELRQSLSKTKDVSTVNNGRESKSIKNIKKGIEEEGNGFEDVLNRSELNKPNSLQKTGDQNSSGQIDFNTFISFVDSLSSRRNNEIILGKNKLNSNLISKFIPLSLLPTLTSGFLTIENPMLDLPLVEIYSDSLLHKKVMRKTPFYLEYSGSLGLVRRTFSAQDNNAENKRLLEQNKDLEKTLFTSGIHLGLGYQFKNGWFLKSGVQYQEVYELLEFEKSDTDEIVSNSDRAFYQIVESDTVFIDGMVNATEIRTRNIIHNSRVKYFSIPLELGYQLSYGKLSVRGATGVDFVFNSKFKGKIIDIENNVLENPTLSLKNRLGYQASLGLAYRCFRKTDVFLNFAYQRSASFIMNNDYQRYQSLNGQIGFRTTGLFKN